MYAGSSSVPCVDFTATMSPWTTPSLRAVSVEISTHASHTACVIVSGASWSQELTALRPS